VVSPGDAAADGAPRQSQRPTGGSGSGDPPGHCCWPNSNRRARETQGQVALPRLLSPITPKHGRGGSAPKPATPGGFATRVPCNVCSRAARSSYPMLDRHEVRADDPQHPVRFELTGVWRDLQ